MWADFICRIKFFAFIHLSQITHFSVLQDSSCFLLTLSSWKWRLQYLQLIISSTFEGWQSCWISLFLLGNWNLHSLQNILFAISIIAFQILNWIDNVLWQIILGKYLLLKFFHPKIISLTSENRNHTNKLTTLGNAYIHISENIPTYLDVCISYAKWLTKDLSPFLHGALLVQTKNGKL